MLDEYPCLLDTKTTAKILGLSPNTLEKYRSYGGNGPQYIRVSARVIRYRKSDLIAFLDSRSGNLCTSDYD